MQVTIEGVRALLQGKFSETVKKFQLGNLQLRNASKSDLMELEKEFRSYQMH